MERVYYCKVGATGVIIIDVFSAIKPAIPVIKLAMSLCWWIIKYQTAKFDRWCLRNVLLLILIGHLHWLKLLLMIGLLNYRYQ
uniref:Uncharacterized protein n=1 Tax=Arsenophonus nasoniae TaxID=638 RepID=D2U2D5_9GAMM|nr:hypothetical protein ARN_27540 [Arsenophonus nasoniae]